MIERSATVVVASPATGWLVRVQHWLSDELMALLALLTVLLTAAPYAFDLAASTLGALTFAEVLVLLLFGLEYGVGVALAQDRAAFVRDPWRLLDAFIIVAVLVSLLPLPTDMLGVSPALRLIRLLRVAVLGTRSSGRLASKLETANLAGADPAGILEARALEMTAGSPRFTAISWEDVLARIGSQQDDWLYVSGIGAHHLQPIAEQLGVPERMLHNKLFEAAFPRLDRLENFATLFTWYPRLVATPAGDVTIARSGLLLVGSAQNVAVLAREDSGLLPNLERRLTEPGQAMPLLVQATHALVKEVIRAYQRAVEHLETSLVAIESAEATLRDRDFLARTFRLRSEITRVRTNLRHLAGVTRNLNSRRVAIRGFDAALPEFQILAGEAADLYERVDDLNTNLAALVEMRLNVSSFQMNKVMRLLAILTTLALIPAVVGGMLGMNLLDNPWPLSLSEVAFWVGSGMLFSMYLFAIKGWLR